MDLCLRVFGALFDALGYGNNLSNVSSLTTGELLTFISFGIAILLLAIAVKFQFRLSVRSEDIRDSEAPVISGLYRFIRRLCFWGSSYLVASIFVLLSTGAEASKMSQVSIGLFNVAFYIVLVSTILISIAYLYTIFMENFIDWLMGLLL